ncbi:non-ribosomal peptide synthetase [Metabacillus arenae]|uniref:Amino acid adenylation domain-containing protein n=1 Tax=Metabacillus arenae TaxID=2771434 RepID=A0A926RW18_9BACI|nr:non-ribosomal peptide synthetase [Metabacillus arenae]MBD1379486.1 amino acid adenylation domain-containing protein [Metabacillus arenae]
MDIKNIENIYECSPIQKGMLFHTIHQPDTSLYVEQISFKIYGYLEINSFQKAWEHTINRHAALRTTFHWKESEKLLQVVHKNVEGVINCQQWDQSSLDAGLQILQYAEDIKNEGIDVSKGPLMKFHLIQLKDCYQFIWTFHHLLMDGWSMPIVLKDVMHSYQSIKNNEPMFLPDAPQFNEYISWLDKQDLDKAKHFFKEKLIGFQEPSYLSGNETNNSRQSLQDQHTDLIIQEKDRKCLEEMARNQDVTLFSILQGLWVLLINSYTDQKDIVIGSVMSGRQPELKGSENIVGPFINTLPIRVTLQASDTVESIIKRVQKEQSELSLYEYTPLFEVQKVSELEPDKSLFDSIIVFENYPFNSDIFSSEELGFSIKDFNVEEKSNFPLSIAIIPYENSLVLRLHYDSSIFSQDEIEKMLDTMSMFIEAVKRDISQRVDALQSLNQKELDEMIGGRDARTLLPESSSPPPLLHQMFEMQVEKSPDKIAVSSEHFAYTYKEVNDKADQVARYLLSQGLQQEESTAVFMTRSPDMMIAMLGILKAGGVYVPLDLHMPKERIQFILTDSAARFIISENQLIDRYSFHNIQQIDIHHIGKADVHNRNHDPVFHAKQGAYIMYTSGSTGIPKGVVVTHEASLLHYLSFKEQFNINKADKVLQFGTTTFDPSLEQVFPTLCSGGEVFIRGDDVWDSEEFVEKVNKYGITVANLPTPYWNEIASHFSATRQSINMKSLRVLAVGGDKLSPAHVDMWNTVHKGEADLFNFYGPTEIITTCTFYKVPAGNGPKQHEQASIPIGNPLINRRMYVLDSMGRPVPSGRKGELYIGGQMLALGYLNQPGLTADSFLPDPFSDEPGARMYKTGDFVSYSSSGEFQFLGRQDDQFKIRGFRVEIGEIEKAILSLPEVKDVLVLVDTSAGIKNLAAYITVGSETSQAKIKSALESKLSDYMIPKFIIFIDEFPLLTNGKVDRKALPKIEAKYLESDHSSYRPPSSRNQQIMTEIWEEVLQIERVGIQDNFFELGGDSILALQIIAKCKENSIEITTKDLFEHQTIERVEESFLSVTPDHDLSISKIDLEAMEWIPFTPIQRWFFEKEFKNPHHWNQSILLEVHEDLNVTLLREAIKKLAEHHDIFSYSFSRSDGKWIQKEKQKNPFEVDVIELDRTNLHQYEDMKRKAIVRAQTSLHIESGPLLRAVYISSQNEGENQLFLTIHHLIVDGVSWRVLLEDLQMLYHQATLKQPTKLPAKTTTFKEWAYTLNQYAEGEIVLRELDYWQKISRIEANIPTDKEMADLVNTEESLKKMTVSFSKEETASLLNRVNRTMDAKIQEILIAALVLVIKKWSNNHHIKIDIEGHGREEVRKGLNLSRTIGWFTTLFPFSIKLQESSSILEDLQLVVKKLRAIPNNGLGYGILKYMKDIQFAGSPSQVSFNYLGQINTSANKNTIFEMSNDSVEPIRDPRALRAYLLDVEGAIYNGELSLDWMYCRHIHKDETVRKLTAEFTTTVKSIIKLCERFEEQKYVPKDFSTAILSESEWNIVNQQTSGIEDIYPLSPVQEGMLFHTLLHPGTGIYVEQMSFEIKGELHIDLLKEAWQHVVDQNSILRANFLWEGFAKPIHIINQQGKVDLKILDWTSRLFGSKEEIKQEIEALCSSQRLNGFHLEKDTLMKLTLVMIDKETYYFIWSYHHLLLDGWSMPMILNQLSKTYSDLLNKRIPAVPSARPFRDFISWQLDQDLSEAESFWKGAFDGYQFQNRTLLLNETKGRIGSSESGSQNQMMKAENANAEIKRKLPKALTSKLKQVAMKEKTTLNTVIQTCWAVFLNFICEKENVVFGSVLSGRPASVTGIDEMVGMFINTLPIGLKVSRQKEIGELLNEMNTLQMRIMEFENTPLINIKEWIGYNSKESLFDTCLIFANFPNLISAEESQAILEGVTVSNVEVEEQTNFPLTLSIVPNDELSLDINYNCSSFNRETIELYFEILEKIITEVTLSLQQPLDEVYKSLESTISKRNENLISKQKKMNRDQLNQRKRIAVNVLN